MKNTFILLSIGLLSFNTGDSTKDIDVEYGDIGNDGARTMVVTDQDNYILAGWYDMVGIHESGKGLVISLDAQGNLNWKKIITTNKRNQISALAVHPKGRIIALIEEFYTEKEPGQVVLIELSNNGEIVNKTQIGGIGADVADKIKATPDGGFILVGESSEGNIDDKQAWVIKLSSTFKKEWEWRKGTPGRDRFNDLIILADGSSIAAGNATRSGKDNNHKEEVPWVVKLDAKGNELWSEQYQMVNTASIRGIYSTKDGGIVFAGFSKVIEEREYNSWIGKIDANGHMIWQHMLPMPKPDYLHKVTPQKDGTYIAVGSYVNSETNSDALFLQFSEDGSMITPYGYPKIGKQEARAVMTKSNGSIIIAGASDSNTGNSKQMWFLNIPALKTTWNQIKLLKNEK